MGDFKAIKEVRTGMDNVINMSGKSCFLMDCPFPDTVVHMGIITMESKDLEKEMAEGTPFGLKLRAIAKKVEALQ